MKIIARRIVPIYEVGRFITLNPDADPEERKMLSGAGLQFGTTYRVSEMRIMEEGCMIWLGPAGGPFSSEHFLPAPIVAKPEESRRK